jgi:hypothetical protein
VGVVFLGQNARTLGYRSAQALSLQAVPGRSGYKLAAPALADKLVHALDQVIRQYEMDPH